MNLDRPEKLNVRLYRDGIGVIYMDTYRRDTHVNPIQKAERIFTIKKTHLRSACLALWSKKKSKHLLFITYTFAFEPSEVDASRIWKLTIDNLRNTYKVKDYVWVKERQQSGRIHYHILCDSDRLPILNLQNSFNNSVLSVVHRAVVSSNSVRLGSRPVVSSPKTVAGYLSKYIAKGGTGNKFTKRAWGTTIKKESYYKQIDINDVISIVHSPKNSAEIKISYREGIQVLQSEDCFLIFKLRDYYDISP